MSQEKCINKSQQTKERAQENIKKAKKMFTAWENCNVSIVMSIVQPLQYIYEHL